MTRPRPSEAARALRDKIEAVVVEATMQKYGGCCFPSGDVARLIDEAVGPAIAEMCKLALALGVDGEESPAALIAGRWTPAPETSQREGRE